MSPEPSSRSRRAARCVRLRLTTYALPPEQDMETPVAEAPTLPEGGPQCARATPRRRGRAVADRQSGRTRESGTPVAGPSCNPSRAEGRTAALCAISSAGCVVGARRPRSRCSSRRGSSAPTASQATVRSKGEDDLDARAEKGRGEASMASLCTCTSKDLVGRACRTGTPRGRLKPAEADQAQRCGGRKKPTCSKRGLIRRAKLRRSSELHETPRSDASRHNLRR